MGIAVNTTFEINGAVGSDSNGGGFNPNNLAGNTIDKTYGVNQAATTRTDLATSSIAQASTPTLATGTGGSMAAGTYQVYIAYTHKDATGAVSCYGTPSGAASITVAASGTVTVTSPAATNGAEYYAVYMTAAGGTIFYLQNSETAIGTNYVQSAAPGTTAANNIVVSSSHLAIPAAPTLTLGTGGSLSAGVYQCKITYGIQNGTTFASESMPSSSTSVTAVANDTITMTSPAASTNANVYGVYMTAAGGGAWYLQNSPGTAIGTNYVQSANPVTNTPQPVASAQDADILTSATVFAASDVGHLIQITAGTGFALAFFEIVSIIGLGVAVLDRSQLQDGLSAGTGTVGGALATAAEFLNAICGTHQEFWGSHPVGWIKSSIVYGSSSLNAGTAFILSGYTNQRGDGGQTTLQLTSGNIWFVSFNGWMNQWYGAVFGAQFNNLIFDGNNYIGSSNGVVTAGGSYGSIETGYYNCVIKNGGSYPGFTGATWGSQMSLTIEKCEIFNCGIGLQFKTGKISNCYIHDNSEAGIYCQLGQNDNTFISISECLIVKNGGQGIYTQSAYYGQDIIDIHNNTIAANSSHGIFLGGSNISSSFTDSVLVKNNIMAFNGGYGLYGYSGYNEYMSKVAGNAYYNNTSGNIYNFTFLNYDPYQSLDIILTGDPFMNRLAGDYRLNTGVGSRLRDASTDTLPAAINYATSRDFGAIQHQDRNPVRFRLGVKT